jgi:hypothetical protein
MVEITTILTNMSYGQQAASGARARISLEGLPKHPYHIIEVGGY